MFVGECQVSSQEFLALRLLIFNADFFDGCELLHFDLLEWDAELFGFLGLRPIQTLLDEAQTFVVLLRLNFVYHIERV